MSSLVFQRATTRVAPTFQAEWAKHVGATLVVALPASLATILLATEYSTYLDLFARI